MTDTTATSEVRLAVDMNGGVSLAVWMGGVTHGIDVLRRASTVPSDADRDTAPAGVPAARPRDLLEVGAVLP